MNTWDDYKFKRDYSDPPQTSDSFTSNPNASGPTPTAGIGYGEQPITSMKHTQPLDQIKPATPMESTSPVESTRPTETAAPADPFEAFLESEVTQTVEASPAESETAETGFILVETPDEEFESQLGDSSQTMGTASDSSQTVGMASDSSQTVGMASDSSQTVDTDQTYGASQTYDTDPTYSTDQTYGTSAGYGTDNYGTSQAYGAEQNYSSNTYGADQTYGANNYGTGASNYGAGNGYYQTYDFTQPAPARRKKERKAMQLTVRGFVLILILAMLVTSGLTVAGISLYDNHFAAGSNSATNYTLTKASTELSYSSIVKKAKNSIVSITTEAVTTDSWAQNYVTKGAGSGVIVQSNGYIVTCEHVISNANKITVTLANSKSYEATLVGVDTENDLAVLKIKATGLDAIDYGDSSSLEVGDPVVAIGNPLGELSNTATTGIVSALNRQLTIEGQKLNLLQTDASINPGNSGGALLDSEGNLIGIVESKSTGSDVEGLGFAVPVNTVAKSVKEIIQHGKVKSTDNGSSDSTSSNKAAIGIVISELSNEQAQMYGYSTGGVYITSVTSQKAQAAGLQSGDMIYSFDGTKISSANDLSKLLSSHKVGDKVKLQILRDGRIGTVTVTLVAATAN